MGFTIYYRSTQPISPQQADAILDATDALCADRTWLSCEPVAFFQPQADGRLLGGSKPNFKPHPDDIAAAAAESLPDGTVHDLIDVLCQLSRDFDVDWEFSHDHDPGPIGFIRGGVCEPRLREQMDTFGELGGILQDLMDGFDSGPVGDWSSASEPDDDDDDQGPPILQFRPKVD